MIITPKKFITKKRIIVLVKMKKSVDYAGKILDKEMRYVRWKMMDMGDRVSSVLVDAYLRESGKESTCHVEVKGETLMMAYLGEFKDMRLEPGEMNEKSNVRVEETYNQVQRIRNKDADGCE